MSQNITSQIRTTFTNYFKRHDHPIVPASSLIPKNDPTLMFTNSGMVQFKNYLTGAETPPFPRAATVQKSVRAGGKHNDLDNVGYTVRHHTFFEMLGNFSFGDYFKEKAIYYAWDLLTHEIGLDKSKLCVTIFHNDEEAFDLWKKIAGLKDDDIIRIATKDNFWQMGDTGPCGPCTEIFYDHGDQYWGGRPGTPEEDGDRFIEIWNLVFDQFEDLPDGRRIGLAKKCIDTGSGLERLSAILHGTNDNFQIDIFKTLIERAADLAGVDPYGDAKISLRVIADHLRSTSFLLADGVMPSNEGRGYVLRRIMRRAMRHAHLIGCRDPLMYRLVPSLIETMGEAYPELGKNQKLITDSLKLEEERFKQTLDKGLKLLAEETASLSAGDALNGETAFKLYDTYGFPLDLTQDALRAKNITVDVDGFEAAMARQKAEARKSWAGSGDNADEKIWFQIADRVGASEFLGYDTDTAESLIQALVRDGVEVNDAQAGDMISLVANQTPFYGEMGGQVGDTGTIKTESGTVEITDTVRKADSALIVHVGRVITGTVHVVQAGVFAINATRRRSIRAHHSATHLLQAALQRTLGASVHQKGSLVTPDYFRFDFTYPKAMTPEECRTVETLVNDMVMQNERVITDLMSPEEAVKQGAMALFDEKYGDTVRVVSMGQGEKRLSCELCGGTHVSATGDIGSFRLVSESAVSSGVRRIEAVVGPAAVRLAQQNADTLTALATALKATSVADMLTKVRTLTDDKKRLDKEVSELRRQVAMGGTSERAETAEQVGAYSFVGKVLHGTPARELKPLADAFKKKIGSGVVALIAETDGKVSVVVGVTADLTGRLNAVDLVRQAAGVVGGQGGGGRPDMAQAGGTDTTQMDQALTTIRTAIQNA